MNGIVVDTAIPGGLYVELLQEELEKRKVRVPLAAHDPIAELKGEQSGVACQSLVVATYLRREDLAKAMITGRKRLSSRPALGAYDKNPK